MNFYAKMSSMICLIKDSKLSIIQLRLKEMMSEIDDDEDEDENDSSTWYFIE